MSAPRMRCASCEYSQLKRPAASPGQYLAYPGPSTLRFNNLGSPSEKRRIGPVQAKPPPGGGLAPCAASAAY